LYADGHRLEGLRLERRITGHLVWRRVDEIVFGHGLRLEDRRPRSGVTAARRGALGALGNSPRAAFDGDEIVEVSGFRLAGSHQEVRQQWG
jgi:hypothetical protein